MTTPMIIDASDAVCRPKVDDACAFLAAYASSLFGSGATCIRLEKNVKRMAFAFGMNVEVSIFPRHIHVSVSSFDNREIFTSISSISGRMANFTVNTLLSRLSWDVADGKVDFESAKRRFDEIIAVSGSDGFRLPLLVSLANAAFCRLFGGDAVAMCVVLVATFAGFVVKQMLGERGVDQRITVIICSFVSSVLAAADGLFSLGSTPEIAIGTSVLYLVPGIPLINSFCDMLDRHYICAYGRMTDALVTVGCLSMGLCCGMLLMDIGMF